MQALSDLLDSETQHKQNKVAIVCSYIKLRKRIASGAGFPPGSSVDGSVMKVKKAERPRCSPAFIAPAGNAGPFPCAHIPVSFHLRPGGDRPPEKLSE